MGPQDLSVFCNDIDDTLRPFSGKHGEGFVIYITVKGNHEEDSLIYGMGHCDRPEDEGVYRPLQSRENGIGRQIGKSPPGGRCHIPLLVITKYKEGHDEVTWFKRDLPPCSCKPDLPRHLRGNMLS